MFAADDAHRENALPNPCAYIFDLETLIPGAEAYGRQWPGEESVERERWVAGAEKTLKPLSGATAFFNAHRGQSGLAIVTRLPLKAGGELIKAVGWRRIFEVYIGAEHLQASMGNAELFAMAIKRLRREPQDCIIVESRISAVRAAKTTGARVCGIGRGLTAWRLRRAGTGRVIGSIAELEQAAR
jgi:beta-phosphoglucomutase-like phosphatase (HAD superfamily)